MSKKYAIFSLLFVGLALASCDSWFTRKPQMPAQADGYAPIYDTANESEVIRSAAARQIVNGGKIYVKGDTLYQVETGKGIHIINIADPATPQKIGFIEIMGCQEISIAGNRLYTNNINDLVVLNIQDVNNVVVVDRVVNTFHVVDFTRPPAHGWYECIKASKGKVIGWELKHLDHPQCNY
jgi:hypothetical protein